jgi:hypothetical protein
VIEVIEVWFRSRSYYVSVDSKISILDDLLLGTVQGSILSHVLYAIFVSPLADLAFLLKFTDGIARLNICAALNYPSNMISCVVIHKMTNKATLICIVGINLHHYCTKFTMKKSLKISGCI